MISCIAGREVSSLVSRKVELEGEKTEQNYHSTENSVLYQFPPFEILREPTS